MDRTLSVSLVLRHSHATFSTIDSVGGLIGAVIKDKMSHHNVGVMKCPRPETESFTKRAESRHSLKFPW